MSQGGESGEERDSEIATTRHNMEISIPNETKITCALCYLTRCIPSASAGQVIRSDTLKTS
jgi:hypothetical protein